MEAPPQNSFDMSPDEVVAVVPVAVVAATVPTELAVAQAAGLVADTVVPGIPGFAVALVAVDPAGVLLAVVVAGSDQETWHRHIVLHKRDGLIHPVPGNFSVAMFR